MEADEQKEIRRRIVKIQQDSSLTPQEKGARMQVCLHLPFTGFFLLVSGSHREVLAFFILSHSSYKFRVRLA